MFNTSVTDESGPYLALATGHICTPTLGEAPVYVLCQKRLPKNEHSYIYTHGHLYVVTRPGINIEFYVVRGNNAFFVNVFTTGR